MNLNMDLITEQQETTSPPPEAVDPITASMNGYIIEKMASAAGQSEPKAVEKSGSAMHLAIAGEVLDRLRQGHHEESIEAWFNQMWGGLNNFVFNSIPEGKRREVRDEPLKKAIEGMTNIDKNGAKGLVTVVYMAVENGCKVIFPTPEEDVFKGIDLILQKEGRRIDLQIKHLQRQNTPTIKPIRRKGQKGKIVKRFEKGKEKPLVLVIVPGRPGYYKNGSQVFPRPENCRQFGEKLDGFLGLKEK
jgi:hypothetical protein